MPTMQNDKKNIIIARAQEIFAQRDDFFSINLSDILKELNISKGSFYHYFKNKDDLIYHLVTISIDDYHNDMQKKIIRLKTIKEQLCHLFIPILDSKLKNQLESIERYHKYLFFENNINKNNFIKKTYKKMLKERKALALKILKINNISVKAGDEAVILLNYLIDTVVFYSIYNKSLYRKQPVDEILGIIDVIYKLLRHKVQTKK